MDQKHLMEFKGGQFGIRLHPRGPGDPHVCFRILSEDDDFWHETDVDASSAWIDDLIRQLTAAKKRMARMKKSRCGFGVEFDECANR